MIKAVIFDMDGLIVDTEPVLAKSVISALKNQSIELSKNEYFEHWTKNGGNVKQYAQSKKIEIDFERYRKEKKETYLKFLKNNIPLIPKVKEKILLLHEKYMLALVSSSDKEFIEVILDSAHLRKYFSVVVGGDEVKAEKPDPDGFLLAAKKMRVLPSECVVLEDAQKGIIAAKAAGMKAIAIPNKHTKNNDFSKADQILKSMEELEI
jgi:HAD superfamily hydrolase (TIGR01509 family)